MWGPFNTHDTVLLFLAGFSLPLSGSKYCDHTLTHFLISLWFISVLFCIAPYAFKVHTLHQSRTGCIEEIGWDVVV